MRREINELNEATSVADDDFLVVDVDNGDGTFSTKKIRKSNLASAQANTSQTAQTGQNIVYQTGDDGGEQRGRDFFKLDEPNHFGNIWRFTGLTGSYFDMDTNEYKQANGTVIGTGGTARATAFPDKLLLDHSTRQPNGNLSMFYLGSTSDWTGEPNLTFATGQTFANTLTVAGFSGWSVCNIRELYDAFMYYRSNMFPPLVAAVENSGTILIVSDTTATYATDFTYFIRIDPVKLQDIWHKTATGSNITRIFIRTTNISEL
jgi:hypothetical protein